MRFTSEDFDEKKEAERRNELEQASEHDRQQMIRFAHNLNAFGDLTPEERAALTRLLRVFDPPAPSAEEPDIPF